MQKSKLPPRLKISRKLLAFVKTMTKVAIEYENLSGRKIGITGEVGEVLVCRKFDLDLIADSRMPGADAIDCNKKLVQIKTRRSETEDEPKLIGRMSRFSEHKCDYVYLAFLDKRYELTKVWRMSYGKRLADLIAKEQTERSGPKLKSFIELAGNPVFTKQKLA